MVKSKKHLVEVSSQMNERLIIVKTVKRVMSMLLINILLACSPVWCGPVLPKQVDRDIDYCVVCPS